MVCEQGDRKFIAPAVQEALNYGEDDPIFVAPDVVATLGRELNLIELGGESLKKIRQAIRLLQEVVRGE